MSSRSAAAVVVAGLIAGGFCLVGSLLPFRPDAISERAWGNAWGMIGLLTGVLVAKRITKVT